MRWAMLRDGAIRPLLRHLLHTGELWVFDGDSYRRSNSGSIWRGVLGSGSFHRGMLCLWADLLCGGKRIEGGTRAKSSELNFQGRSAGRTASFQIRNWE